MKTEKAVGITAFPEDDLTQYRSYATKDGSVMVARTGWGSDSVIATMTVSEYNPMNHGHFDCGHFMIYYKGILANDSGWYEKHGSAHHSAYMSQTVAHNCLLVGTPYNKWGNQNQGIDGPVKTPVDSAEGKNFWWIDDTWEAYQANRQNRWAKVIGHGFGPDSLRPSYSYLAGDLTDAYTSDYDDGVDQVLRHMLFLSTGDEKKPAAFVVFDRIGTKLGGYQKAFLLHSEQEPEVSGNVTTIKRTEGDYNGKLINQTLLPRGARLEKIGGAGKRFWNKDKNWPFIQDDPTVRRTADPCGGPGGWAVAHLCQREGCWHGARIGRGRYALFHRACRHV